MRILIVEDDPKIRSYIEKGLREAGHTIDLAEDGEIGLHMATTEKYDVLIVDRMLPKLDGLSLIRTLRGTGNTTCVLILSSLGDVDDRVTGLRVGGDDYLVSLLPLSSCKRALKRLAKGHARRLPNPQQCCAPVIWKWIFSVER